VVGIPGMTRGILGKFFDWTLGLLGVGVGVGVGVDSDAKKKESFAAAERAEKQLHQEIKKVKYEERREKEQRGREILAKKNAVIEKIKNDARKKIYNDPEFRQIELDYDRVMDEITAKYAQKLEIVWDTIGKDFQAAKDRYFAFA